MRTCKRFLVVPGLVSLAISACGSTATQPSASATSLPPAEVRRLYLQAAAAYTEDEPPIEAAEYSHCTPGTGNPDLHLCQQALSQDRQTTLAFDNAVRQISFPDRAQTDVGKLLSDDARLEALLEQAATAPSLNAIQALSGEIFSLLTETTADSDRVRADIGLPAATTAPVSPSASASAQP
jgi:hypothetical protein